MTEEVKNSVVAQKCDHNHFLHPLCKNPSYSTGEKAATIALLILLNVVTAGIPLIIYSLYKAFSKKILDGTKPTAVLERLPEIKSNQQQNSISLNTNQKVPDINDNDNDDFIPCSAAAARAFSSRTTSNNPDSSNDNDDSLNNNTLYPTYSFSQSGNKSTYSMKFPSPPSYSYSSSASPIQNQLNYCDEFLKHVTSSVSVGNSQTLESSNPLETIQNQALKHCTQLLKNVKGEPKQGAFTLTFNLDNQAFIMEGKMHKEPLSGLANKIKRTYDSDKTFKKLVNTTFERSNDELHIEFRHPLSSGKTICITQKIKQPFQENSFIHSFTSKYF